MPNQLTNVNIMTFLESASKHEAFNEVLTLINSKPEFRNSELFDQIYNLAIKQGQIGDEILNNK
tara:strand:- start:2600 stop:2791 length:192 start_codon:yes stop_codon:yes gene_type:complete